MAEKKTVLIIDDDAMVGGPPQDALGSGGFEVRCCDGSASALELMLNPNYARGIISTCSRRQQ